MNKGLPASLMGIIPYSVVDLCLFNTLKVKTGVFH